MSFLNQNVADIPHLEWTANLDHRFAERSLAQLAVGAIMRVDRAIDTAVHPRHKTLAALAQLDTAKLQVIDQIIDANADGGIRFVQIGAHDGDFDDPFTDRISDFGWHALLVEPQSDAFASLYNRYKDVPNVTAVNYAIGTQAGNLTLYKAILPERYKNQGTAIATTDRRQVRAEVMRTIGFFGGLTSRIIAEEVTTLTLPQLLDLHDKNPKSIDFFACDTEGFDTEVVSQLLATGAKPELLQYEHLHANKDEVEKIDRRLRLAKYTLIKTHKDTFCYR